jgi:phospholipase/carboxylesterase
MTDLRFLPPSGEHPNALIILLHGVGGDATTMEPLARALMETQSRTIIVIPDAPVPFDLGHNGFQWFSIRDVTQSNRGDRIREALPIVQKIIDQEAVRYRLPRSRVGICGFSQGGMMALALADAPNPPAAIASIAGRIAAPPKAQTVQAPHILLTHGDADQTVPFHALAEAATAFESANYPVSTLTVGGLGHQIGQVQVQSIAHFFADAFARELEGALP